MSTVIYSLTHSPDRARLMVATLEAMGIPESHLTLLFPYHHEPGERDPLPTRPLAQLLAGGMLSGTLGWTMGLGVAGWFVGLTAMLITGVTFVPSLLLLTALSFAALCALAGALIGLGFSAQRDRLYGERVRKHGVVLAVHDVPEDDIDRIDRILADSGAEQITHAPEPSRT
jgi:hypothetical protein